MNKLVLIVAGAALLGQGYLSNRKEAELKQRIFELTEKRWEFYAKCEEAIKKCGVK